MHRLLQMQAKRQTVLPVDSVNVPVHSRLMSSQG